MFTDVQSITVHKSQKLETNKPSVHQRTCGWTRYSVSVSTQWTIIQPQERMILWYIRQHKKRIGLTKIIQMQKDKFCRIPLVWSIWATQSHSHRKWTSRGRGRREVGTDGLTGAVSVRGEAEALQVDSGAGPATMGRCQMPMRRPPKTS